MFHLLKMDLYSSIMKNMCFYLKLKVKIPIFPIYFAINSYVFPIFLRKNSYIPIFLAPNVLDILYN